MRITIDIGNYPIDPPHVQLHGKYTLDELIKFLTVIYPDFTWKNIVVCDKLPDIIHCTGMWSQIQSIPSPSWPTFAGGYNVNTLTGTNTK